MLPEVKRSEQTSLATINELVDGTIVYEFRSDILIDTADVDKMIELHGKLAEGHPRRVLVITGDRMHTTPEARKADRNDIRKKISKAEAIVISNLATRIATNFYYTVQRPPYPVKTFGNVKDAYAWLTKF